MPKLLIFWYNKVPLVFCPLVQEKSGWTKLILVGEISTHDSIFSDIQIEVGNARKIHFTYT
jgi:hypothetical protein